MYYVLKSEAIMAFEEIEKYINVAIEEEFIFEKYDDYTYVMETGISISKDLSSRILPLIADLGVPISILGTPILNYEIYKDIMPCVQLYANNTYISLSDLALKGLLKGDKTVLEFIKKQFDNIDKEIMRSVIAYIKCGNNVIESSKVLYVHRNTMNYRLNKFMDETRLDLRDNEHTMLIYLYGIYQNMI